jgi:hypothetical protein
MLVIVILEGRKNSLKGLISIIKLLIYYDLLSVYPTLVIDSLLLY